MHNLTPVQKKVFDYLLERFRNFHVTPTLREIASHFNWGSTNAVRTHLRALERKGYITRQPRLSRSLFPASRFLADGKASNQLPILGRIAAGNPISAIENLEGYLDLASLYDPACHFCLRVQGDSMIEAGILDGDLVIVRKQPGVENGEIGVAVIHDVATVKYIHHTVTSIELVPANERHRTVTVTPSEPGFFIAGKVVGVHRSLSGSWCSSLSQSLPGSVP